MQKRFQKAKVYVNNEVTESNARVNHKSLKKISQEKKISAASRETEKIYFHDVTWNCNIRENKKQCASIIPSLLETIKLLFWANPRDLPFMCIQSTVSKKMATSTFTYNAKHAKTAKTLIIAHRKAPQP